MKCPRCGSGFPRPRVELEVQMVITPEGEQHTTSSVHKVFYDCSRCGFSCEAPPGKEDGDAEET